MKKLLKELKSSMSIIAKNPFGIIYQVFFDILFMFLYGVLILPIMRMIITQISAIMTVSSASVMAGGNTAATIGTALKDTSVVQYLHNIVWLYLIAGIAFYILFSFFQGINWKIASWMTGDKMHFYKFMGRFFIVNIIWVIAYAFYHFISIYSDFQLSALERISPGTSITTAVIVSFVYWIVMFYFSVISYCLIIKNKPLKAIKTGFSLGVKKAMEIIPVFIAISIAVIIVDLLLRLMSGPAILIAGILIFLPVLAWSRLFAYITIKNV
jgi:hypothetical protein